MMCYLFNLLLIKHFLIKWQAVCSDLGSRHQDIHFKNTCKYVHDSFIANKVQDLTALIV